MLSNMGIVTTIPRDYYPATFILAAIIPHKPMPVLLLKAMVTVTETHYFKFIQWESEITHTHTFTKVEETEPCFVLYIKCTYLNYPRKSPGNDAAPLTTPNSLTSGSIATLITKTNKKLSFSPPSLSRVDLRSS